MLLRFTSRRVIQAAARRATPFQYTPFRQYSTNTGRQVASSKSALATEPEVCHSVFGFMAAAAGGIIGGIFLAGMGQMMQEQDRLEELYNPVQD